MINSTVETDIGMNLNRSNILAQIHPCYKLDVSNVRISTLSVTCGLFYVFLGSVAVLTVCGNLLVILAIIYFKQLHTPTNFLVLSLAVADLLVGALVLPLTMEFSVTSCLFYNVFFCKIRGTFDVSLCTASILNLCCISIDRYYAVCHPLKYRTKINDRVIVVMILLSWALSVLTGIGYISAGLTSGNCDTKCFAYFVIANILGLVFSFYLPVIVMLCIYVKIFLVAQRQVKSIQNTKSVAAVSKKERKATKTLAIVMGVFLLCWLPFFLCTTILSFSHFNVSLVLIEILNYLALSNSMINPFIYAFFYSWYRSAFRLIISGKVIQGSFSNSELT